MSDEWVVVDMEGLEKARRADMTGQPGLFDAPTIPAEKEPHEMSSAEFGQKAVYHGAVPMSVVGIDRSGLDRGDFTPDPVRASHYAWDKSGMNAMQAIKMGRSSVPPKREGAVYVGFPTMPGQGVGNGRCVKVVGKISRIEALDSPHKALARQAMSSGKTVPPHVMAEYPDLARQ